ncbi:MAG: tetratricopeptide repeat protein [Myxococcales bacterium]|nr:tetratricopeptide repeat protein [Myxococcales bacterium]
MHKQPEATVKLLASLEFAPLDAAELTEQMKPLRTAGDWTALLELLGSVGALVRESQGISILWDKFADTLVEMASQESDLSLSAKILRKAATIRAEYLSEPLVAAELLRRAFERFPSTDTIDQLLDLIDRPAERETVGELLALRLSLVSDGPERAAALAALGHHCLDVGLPDDAERHFLLALEVDFGCAGALSGIERLDTFRSARKRRIMGLREAAQRARSDKERAASLVRLGDALSESGFHVLDEAALDELAQFYSEAFKLTPTADTMDKLAAVLTRRKNWGALRELYAGSIHATTEGTADDALRFRAHRGLGVLLSQHGEDGFVEAKTHLLSAMEIEPNDVDVLTALAVVFRGTEQWGELATTLDKLRSHTRSKQKEKELLEELADIRWRRLRDMEGSERIFRRLRSQDPRNLEALTFYEAYYRENKDWRRLYGTLAQKFAIVEDGERRVVAREMAELAQNEMASPEKAIEAWRRVVDLDPDDVEAGLALAEVLAETGKWHALLELHNLAVDAAERVGDTATMLRHLDALLHVYTDPLKLPMEEMAYHTRRRIADVAPDRMVILDALAGHYEERGLWRDLVAILERRLQFATSDNEKAALRKRIVDVWMKRLGNESAALPYLEATVAADPADLEAIRALRRVYRVRRDVARLSETYRAELDLVSGSDRKAVLAELATFAGQAGDVSAATRYWEEVLSIDPGDEKARQQLEDLYTAAQRWDLVIGLLRQRLKLPLSKRKRAEILERIGVISADFLQDVESAKLAFVEVTELSPYSVVARTRLKEIHEGHLAGAELESLYAEKGDWKGYIRLLEDTLRSESDEHLQIELNLEIARIYAERLDDSLRAMRHLDRVLELDPAHVAVARLLIPIAEEKQNYRKLASLLEVVATYSDDEQEVSGAVARLVELATRRRDTSVAMFWLCRQFELQAGQGRLGNIAALEEFGEKSNDYEMLANAYAGAVALLPKGSEESLVVTRNLARVLKEKLRRYDDAKIRYFAVLEVSPSDSEAMAALQDIFLALRDWDGLEDILWRRVAVTEDPGDTRDFLLKLGELYESVLMNPERAVDVFNRMRSIDPNDVDASEGLKRTFELEERWAELLEVLVGELESQQGVGQQATLLEMAEIHERKLGQRDKAIDAYSRILDLNPRNETAIEALVSMLDDSEWVASILTILEKPLRMIDDPERLSEWYARRIGIEEDEYTKWELTREYAHLLESRMFDADAAYPLFRNVASYYSYDLAAWSDAERTAIASGEADDWIGWVAAATGVGGDGRKLVTPLTDEPVRLELLRKQAQYLEEHARLADAILCYEEVLGATPSDPDVLNALQRLYSATSDWECVLLIGRKQAEMAADPLDRKSVFVRMGQVLDRRLGRSVDAIDYYSRALVLDGTDSELIGALDRLFTSEQRWEELVDLLRRKATLLTDPGQMIALYLRLADILANQIADDAAATDALTAVVRLDPSHVNALEQLETILHRRLASSPRLVNPGDVDLLRSRLVDGNQWERVILLDELRVALAETPESKASILIGISETYSNQLQDHQEAFGACVRAVRETPTENRGWSLLFDLAETLNYWDRASLILDEQLAQLDAVAAVPLRLLAAKVATERLADHGRAVEHLDAVRSVEPDNVNVLEQLDTALAASGINLELWAQIKGELVRFREGDDRLATVLDMGRLYLQVGNSMSARAAFEVILDVASAEHPIRAQAVLELIGVYEDQGEWALCVGALETAASRTDSTAQRTEWLVRAADLLERQLNQPEKALEVLTQLRESGGGSDDISEGIERILEARGDWTNLLAHFQHEHERRGPELRRSLRAGMVAEERLLNWGQAAVWYEIALSLDSAHPDVIRAVERLMQCPDAEIGFHASELLVLAFELHDDVRGLVDTYAEQITRFPAKIDVRRRHLDIAELLEVRLDDPSGAWGRLGEAWKLAPEDEGVWSELIRLADIAGCWDQLTDLVITGCSTEQNPVVNTAILWRLVKVFREVKPNPDAAAEALQMLLRQKLDPHEKREVIDELEQVYAEIEAWSSLVDILRQKAGLAIDGFHQIAIKYQIAAILQANLGAFDEALTLYEEILAVEPTEVDALICMESIYRRRHAWADVAAILRRQLTHEREPEKQTAIVERLLEVVGTQLYEVSEALDLSKQLLDTNPTNEVATLVLMQLQDIAAGPRLWNLLILAFDARGDWNQLAIVLERATAEGKDSPDYIEWLLKLVDIYENVLKLPEVAYQTGKRYVTAQLTMPAVVLLRRLAEPAGQWRDLAVFLEQLAETESSGLRTAILKEVAEIRERVLDDPEGAAALYERLLPEDAQVQLAAEALERLYRRLGRFEELGELFEHLAVTSADDSTRLLLYLKAANIWDETVSMPHRAEAMLLQVLARRPNELEALQRLERVYLRTQEFEKLTALYSRWPVDSETAERQAELLFKQAFLLANELHRPDMAITRLKAALEQVPNYPAAVRFLETMLETLPFEQQIDGVSARLVVADILSNTYDDSTDWERQLAVCEARLAAPMEPQQRVEVLLRLAKLLRTWADDTESAFLRLAEALLLAPEREDVRALTAGVAEGAGLLTDLRDLYLEVAAAEPAYAAAYTLWAAELVEDQLGNEDGARSLYERVLQLDSGNESALNALERYYSVRGNVRGVIDILHQRLASGHVENRFAQLIRLGQLQEEVGLTADAIESYRASLDLEPRQPAVIEQLETIYLRREDWVPYVQMLQLKIEWLTEAGARVDVLSRMAQVFEKNLSQPEEAARCLQAIFSENPGNLYAISGLERLYPQIAAWEPLLGILNHKRGMLANPKDRVAVDFQVAQIHHLHLGDIDKALDYYRLVLARDDHHQGTIAALETLLENDAFRFSVSLILEGVFEQIGEWRKLAHLHRAQLPYLNDVGEKMDLYLRAASIQEERLYDPDEAISVLASALRDGLVPAVIRDRMIDIAERHDRWDSLVFSVGTLVDDVADADTSKEINLWLAQINENKLHDVDAAIERYRRVLDFDENHPTAVASLERLLDQEGRFEELVDLWRARLASGVQGEQRLAIQLRLADMLAEQIGESSHAVEILKDVIWETPGNEDAQERLERIATLEPSCRVEIVEMLEPIYRRQQRWRNLVHLFELRIESAETRSDRAKWAIFTADVLAAQLREPERALDYYLAALVNAPGETLFRMDTIESTAISLDRLNDLADALDRVLVDTTYGGRRADLAVRAAVLYRERLSDIRRAEELLRVALEVDPMYPPALDALENLYESTGRHADLVEVCDRKLRLSLGLDEKKRLLFRLGDAARVCRQEQRAIDAFRQILAMDPAETKALRRLESIFEKAGDLASLADILERQSTTVASWTPDVISTKIRLAKIKETELQDPRAAIEVYEEILDHDPVHGESLVALERLFRQLGMWDQLREVLERQLQTVTNPISRTTLYVRLAKLYEHELDDLDTAVRIYESLLDNDPDNVEALNELVRLMHKHGRWEDLASLYEQKLAQATSLSDKSALLLRSAEIYDKYLDDPAKALECLHLVLKEDPQNRLAMQHIAMLRERHGEWQEAVRILEHLLETTQEPKARSGILVKLGVILLDRANDTRQSQQYLLQAVRLDADDRDANEALRRLYIARESWEALLEILQRQLRWAGERSEKAAKCREIALVYRDKLRNDSRFVQWIEEAHEIDPNDAATVEELVKIAEEDADQDRLVPLLQWLVQHYERLRNYDELPAVAHRLGQVYEGLGDDVKASEYYRLAYRHDATYLPGLLSLGRLLLRTGELEQARGVYQAMQLQQNTADTEVKVETFYNLGLICRLLDDPRRAKQYFQRVLRIDKDHAPTLAELEALE